MVREGHSQHPLKINVWAGILGNHIVGPIFYEDNLTGEMYLNMLQEVIVPTIIDIAENDPELDPENIFFMQDGAPPHFARPVRDFLDHEFPNKWIGRRGFIEWPARSPDLTPLDFFCGVI